MSESKIILNLSTYFPGKSESYLKKIYRRCNCDVAATIDAINDEDSGKKNFFKQFFEKLASLLQFFFTLIKPASEETEDNEKDDNDEDEVLQINIGQDSIIKISARLQKLFEPYVESILKQQEAEEKKINDLIAQNEARIVLLSDQKIFFAQDEEVIDQVDAEPQGSSTSFENTENQTSSFFREKERVFLEKFKKLEQFANGCLERGYERSALRFSEKAKKEWDLAKEYNHLAVKKRLEENAKGQSENYIDFYGLTVKESLPALDKFLDKKINFLQTNNLEMGTFEIVTGRELHSVGMIPRIKNAVIERLNNRILSFSETNRGGRLNVTLYQHSLLTSDLQID